MKDLRKERFRLLIEDEKMVLFIFKISYKSMASLGIEFSRCDKDFQKEILLKGINLVLDEFELMDIWMKDVNA